MARQADEATKQQIQLHCDDKQRVTDDSSAVAIQGSAFGKARV